MRLEGNNTISKEARKLSGPYIPLGRGHLRVDQDAPWDMARERLWAVSGSSILSMSGSVCGVCLAGELWTDSRCAISRFAWVFVSRLGMFHHSLGRRNL